MYRLLKFSGEIVKNCSKRILLKLYIFKRTTFTFKASYLYFIHIKLILEPLTIRHRDTNYMSF